MENTSLINNVYKLKDILKGQKIVAALYLVTAHLSDNDPIKVGIRDGAVALVTTPDFSDFSVIGSRITTLLQSATIIGLVSEKNTSIITSELKSFITKEMADSSIEMRSFFNSDNSGEAITESVIKKTSPNEHLSFKTHTMSVRTKKSQAISDNKNKRQKDILSFINQKKSVGIKDIAHLLSDISEKTIQRELNLLVQLGLITKRGTKRWSTYMAVTK